MTDPTRILFGTLDRNQIHYDQPIAEPSYYDISNDSTLSTTINYGFTNPGPQILDAQGRAVRKALQVKTPAWPQVKTAAFVFKPAPTPTLREEAEELIEAAAEERLDEFDSELRYFGGGRIGSILKKLGTVAKANFRDAPADVGLTSSEAKDCLDHFFWLIKSPRRTGRPPDPTREERERTAESERKLKREAAKKRFLIVRDCKERATYEYRRLVSAHEEVDASKYPWVRTEELVRERLARDRMPGTRASAAARKMVAEYRSTPLRRGGPPTLNHFLRYKRLLDARSMRPSRS